jgi:hypothetical protein
LLCVEHADFYGKKIESCLIGWELERTENSDEGNKRERGEPKEGRKGKD